MSVKERPLIKAVERLGPLPGFLFAHPIVAGFFAMFMCPIFGAVFVLFWSLTGTAPQVFEAMRIGAYVATAFSSLIFIGIFISAFREPDEKTYRLLFVLGGALCVAFLVLLDVMSVDYVRAYVEGKGHIICTSGSMGCDF